MKKAALIVTILVFFMCFKLVKAQTFDAAKAYQDYQYNLTIYNQAYSDFSDAKNAYLANPTLSLKEDARQKTLTMLTDRDQLMIVYLTALRMQIVELTGLSDSDKNAIFGKIDSEISWYTADKAKYSTDYSLEDLFNRSSESESRYGTNTSLVVYESLADISLGQEIGIRQTHEQIYTSVKDIINKGVAAGTLTLNPFNHWLNDIDSTISTLKTNENQARTQIQQIDVQTYSPQSSYQNAVNVMSNSAGPLSQFNEFLTEVINYIRNQQ